MIIIGVDFHPGFQQIAFVDSESGEFQEKRLAHREEAESFYRSLASTGQKVRVGMEASGYARWFERLLSEVQVELWIGERTRDRNRTQASPQAEDGPGRCGAHSATDVER